jgi:hypothetical protein
MPHAILLDGAKMPVEGNPDQRRQTWYLKDVDGNWSISHDTRWGTIHQRYGRQLGALDAFLRTQGTFVIKKCSPGVDSLALQTSRNLLQYLAADSQIREDCSDGNDQGHVGNVVTLAVGIELPPPKLNSFPIRIDRDRLVILRNDSILPTLRHEYLYEPGLGAVFLRPLEDQRLELVVWGADLAGLRYAARLVPTTTGSGQPDYVVVSDRCRWKGFAGVYEAGHLDRSWQISPGSYHGTDPIL